MVVSTGLKHLLCAKHPDVNLIYSSQDSLKNCYCYPHITELGLTMTLICRSKQGSPGNKVGGSKDMRSLEVPEAC